MKKIVTLIIICLIGCGCTVQYLYSQMDSIAPWYVKSYIELEKNQTRFVKRRVQYHLQWHRRTQLKEYIAVIDHILSALETAKRPSPKNAPTKEDQIFLKLNNIELGISKLSEQLASQIAPDLTQLFLTASPEQLQEMYQRFNRQNETYRQEHLKISPAQLIETRNKKKQHQIERWIGHLNTEQMHQLKHWGDQYAPTEQAILYNRLRWQARFKELMAYYQNHNTDVSSDLNLLFSHPKGKFNTHDTSNFEHNRQLTIRLYSRIIISLTDKQNQRAIKKLTKLRKGFTNLLQQSNS